MLAGFKTPSKIQPLAVLLGQWHGWCLRIYGQLWYLYLNENSGKRNLNVNRNNLDDNWNDNCRAVAVANLFV